MGNSIFYLKIIIIEMENLRINNEKEVYISINKNSLKKC
jgi:hypothetical protein